MHDSESSENVSMTVQLSDEMCESKLANSSRSTVEDNSVKHKKAKLSEEIASGSSGPLKQQPSSPELPHKLPAKFRQEGNLSDEGSEEVSGGVHTNMFGVTFVV